MRVPNGAPEQMPTATVDLTALRANLELAASLTAPGTIVMPPLKADAYGHGAVPVATYLEQHGYSWFAVATAAELLELRAAGVSADLLLLTPLLVAEPALFDSRTALTLADASGLGRLQAWGAPRGTRLHLKVDTGLGRLGQPPEQAVELAIQAERAGYVIEAAWTHFASAEDDPLLTRQQLDRFGTALDLLKRAGIEPRLRHAANSAATLLCPEAHFDMIRPGLLTYGYSPLEEAHPLTAALRPALTLTAPVTMCKRVTAGTGLSYNHLWHADRDTNILSVRCGYADGYRRLLSGRTWAALRGERLEQRGRIAMDQLLLDAGGLTAEPGERVTLIGGAGPGADELGQLAQSNAYDILTSLGRRVQRRWLADQAAQE